jgi:hypothetical protein
LHRTPSSDWLHDPIFGARKRALLHKFSVDRHLQQPGNVLMHRFLQRSFAEKMMFDTADLIGTLRRYGKRVGASCLDDRREGNGAGRLTIMEKMATASKALHPLMFTFRCVLEGFFLVAVRPSGIVLLIG